jgi:hypothetical protein
VHWREADPDDWPELRLRRPEYRSHSCGLYFGCATTLEHYALPATLHLTNLSSWVVFETEMMGIEGVPKPESIATKSATDEGPASSASEKVAEKVASVVSEAAEAVKTVVADTDDVQEHNEL